MATGAAKNEDLKVNKLFDVSNYSAIVTSSATSIGLVITQNLVANGAKVYIAGRRKEVLEAMVNKYNKYNSGPGKIIALPGDITRKEVATLEPKGIHVLVNNAGIARDENTKFSSAGTPDFNWLLPILAKALEATPGFSPSIINVTSTSDVMKGPSGGQFAYASSKAAFIHLTRMMATIFIKAKTRVNSIAPSAFPSEMTAGESDEHQKSDLRCEASNPSGRFGHERNSGCVSREEYCINF